MAMSSTKQTIITVALFSWPAIVLFEFAPLFLFMLASGCSSLILGLRAQAIAGVPVNMVKPRFPRPKYKAAVMWSLLGLVALSQVSVFLVVYAHRTDWTLVKEFPGLLSRLMGQLIPAIGAVAEEAKAAEYASRVDVVRDAASMGHVFSLLLALVVVFMPLKKTSAGYRFFSDLCGTTVPCHFGLM